MWAHIQVVVGSLSKLTKNERQNQLNELLHNNPFITDEEIAQHFRVSIQTVRLDRLEKSIPELRERIKLVAKQNYDEVKSLPAEEVIGDIIDLQLDNEAISILDIREEHVFTRNQIARGHHLFAQANSLAIALIDDELALTSTATIRFVRPVKLGDRVIAKAEVSAINEDRTVVDVQSYITDKIAFEGTFHVHRLDSIQE